MTVNELIETLKGIGDEQFRDSAKVRVIVHGAAMKDLKVDFGQFDVKTNVANVDIHVDVLGLS